MDDSCAGDRWANLQGRHPTWINPGHGISENVVWYVVLSGCARRLEPEHLAPHDLRRRAPSYAIQTAEHLSKSSFFLGTPLF